MSGEQGRLQALVTGARAAGRLALDTEFMGEGRYRTLLCLVQLAIPEDREIGENILVIDPLLEGFDGSALAEVLADPAIEIVVHAGRQDIALLRRYLCTEVTNVFDTQIAAGFAGLGAQVSYDSLLAEVLGLRVAKTASFTRWDARPLSPEQIAYAREDVVHLLELASKLEHRLQELGRLQWAREECEPLAHSSDKRTPETIFARLPRVNTLNASARTVAHELVRWREHTAERHDRPVQSVLGDATLVEIAKRRPTSRGELEKIRGVGSSASGRRAEELLEAVRVGREQPPDPPGETTRSPSSKPDDAPLVALGEALLRTRAREAGLAYELLATRADLQTIVIAARTGGDEADVRTLRGWRRELAGAELLDLLNGGISLSVQETSEGRRVRISDASG
ncbi:MAG TPA: HRDC domain-containing protein [Solirubrobacteraceae bacterium]|jgi:ribonuclease D|nr:HRDC domain-containing protein [Solirubrobacteraceae bacterium]